MKCPICGDNATTVFRDLFSRQGVPFAQKAKGYFKCQHCNSLLRVTGYTNNIWYYYAADAIILALFVLFYQPWLRNIGSGAIAAIWISTVLIVSYIIAHGLIKCSEVGDVEND